MAGVDDYVLATDVYDSKLTEVEGLGSVPASTLIASRGDKLPKSLSDERDLFVDEGVLIPKAKYDELNSKDWHSPTSAELTAAENLEAADYSKSDLAKVNEAAEAVSNSSPAKVPPSDTPKATK